MREKVESANRPVGQNAEFDLLEAYLPTSLSQDVTYAAADIPRGRILRIRDLPLEDRPRERLLSDGPRVLSTYELLAVLIGSGNHAAGQSAMELAQTIMVEVNHNDEGALKALQSVSAQELQNVYGVGPAKAAILIAAIELGKRVFTASPAKGTIVDDPSVAAAYLGPDLMWKSQENFAVIYLDVKHRILGKKVISVGTATETLAHPRDIFRDAVRQNSCTRILVAHNHPSGSLEASAEDISLTRQILDAGKLLAIPVLDHLIIGDGDFQSIRQTSELWIGQFDKADVAPRK